VSRIWFKRQNFEDKFKIIFIINYKIIHI
jgi:hypothetical protein